MEDAPHYFLKTSSERSPLEMIYPSTLRSAAEIKDQNIKQKLLDGVEASHSEKAAERVTCQRFDSQVLLVYTKKPLLRHRRAPTESTNEYFFKIIKQRVVKMTQRVIKVTSFALTLNFSL